MKDMVRASDITEAMTTIRVLNDKVAELSRQVEKWRIQFDVSVEPDSQAANGLRVVISAHAGDRGCRKMISQELMASIAGEDALFAGEMAKNIVVELLGEIAANELVPLLSRAMQNARQLNQRRGK